MKKLKVTGPESPEAVEAAYQSSHEKHDRERLLAIRLGQRGQSTLQEIDQLLGRGRATLARWVQAFRQGGIELLLTRRHKGSRGRVSESLQQELGEAYAKDAGRRLLRGRLGSTQKAFPSPAVGCIIGCIS